MIIGTTIIDDDWSTEICGDLNKKVFYCGVLCHIYIYSNKFNEYCIWLPHSAFFKEYKSIYLKDPDIEVFKTKTIAANHVDEFLNKLSKLKYFL